MSEQDYGLMIKQISDRMSAAADASFRRHGLTSSQANVLGYLSERGGEATQKEIARHLGVAHTTVLGLVSRLTQAGFLTWYPGKNDKRSRVICMTEQAWKLDAVLARERQEHEARLVSGLDAQEREEFRHMLEKVCRNYK